MTNKMEWTRRDFIKVMGSGIFLTGLNLTLPLPTWATTAFEGIQGIPSKKRYDLAIGHYSKMIDDRKGMFTAVNGTVPAPLIRLKEGDTVELNVTNTLSDNSDTSIHWHGILVPFQMDGVPGINFAGIKPGDTYHYKFSVKQAGTYWYHSHSRFQEQTGTYGPLVIDPKDGEPFAYDRDHFLVLSDWSFEDPETLYRHINLMGGYYNFNKRTFPDFLSDISEEGFKKTISHRMAWGKMRMSPVDIADVTGATYTYLINGHSPMMNWTGLFRPGEVVRLRVINASAMTSFDVRIPGLDMDIVMADGKAVMPVRAHEFRIGVAETYDVLIRPQKPEAFTVFAESIDRSGFARATLAPQPGMESTVPKMRKPIARTLDDIGMGMMADMVFGGGMKHDEMADMDMGETMHDHHGMSTSGMQQASLSEPTGPEPFSPVKGDPNVAMVIPNPKTRLSDPGIGLGDDGWKVLTYKDLISAEPQVYKVTPDREITINITANMERYMFSFDGKKFTDHEGPYQFKHNERLRLYLVNHTMMEHPIHLHGMWMQLENGADKLPYKHTVLIKPGEVMSLLITPIEKGDWAFHCHLLYHMEAGMFQVVRVS
ncbi:MAG: copper resistance system multicopper oxidase [Proteobacteria bacterium]|nr:copper resistance system multicopper oxidase [Pseudomonadota bacterium]MBU4470584.1 copper resistance system multicopper oxidase [Pseudomonadota bacterium]MCG2751419.1 copper resistance system multicopper oxidase [Desulfobacteraceae bacterium]